MANKNKKAPDQKPAAEVKAAAGEKNSAAKTDKKAKAADKKPNIFVRMGRAIKRFVKGFFSEGKKIIWADGKTVLKNTGVVLGVIVFIGIFVWLFDFGVERLLVYSVSASPMLQTEQAEDETDAETEADTQAETEADTQAAEDSTAPAEDTAAAAGMMNLLDGFIIG